MKLIHQSGRARNAVHSVPAGGNALVGSLVLIMLLVVLGDIVGPVAMGEAGLEMALFDAGGESVFISFQNWTPIEMLLGASAAALAASVMRIELLAMIRRLLSALRARIGKVPI